MITKTLSSAQKHRLYASRGIGGNSTAEIFLSVPEIERTCDKPGILIRFQRRINEGADFNAELCDANCMQDTRSLSVLRYCVNSAGQE